MTKSGNEISASIRDSHFLLLTVRLHRRGLVLQVAVCSLLCFRIIYKSDFSCLPLSLTELGVRLFPHALFDLIDLVESETQLFEMVEILSVIQT